MASNPAGDGEYEDAMSPNCADGPLSEESPACLSCRKKKSKCSREQPCSQCIKSGVECTYEDKRLKGGIKTGVVERLNQRIDSLESMFLGQGILLQQFMEAAGSRMASGRLPPSSDDHRNRSTSLHDYTDKLKQTLSSAVVNADPRVDELRATCPPEPTPKRKREYESLVPSKRSQPNAPHDLCEVAPLPKEIDDVLAAYFKVVHPWVPILHPSTFVARARDPERHDGVTMILKAVVAVAAKHVRKSNDEDVNDLSDYAETCRRTVVEAAMESSSIEAVQALLLIAFDTIGSGQSQSPWSLVSIITRKVEDLQLYSEEALSRDPCAEYFATTQPLLQLDATWLETEELRRVFWAAFLMDRFRSIVTGTNPAISSKMIRRRLPCDGCMWESNQCVQTSYFKKDDQPQSEEPNVPDETCAFPSPYATQEGPNGVGGLAYTIEATESLSLVKKFSVRYPLEPENASQLSAWLNRFRQLDSRLLQWELCLTQRWRDVRVVNGYIDPNLTLAHMTHNAAIIALHRRLAHPSSQSRAWLSGLVSAASREACVMAAMKIDKISRRYLAVSDGIAPHQFAFCLFAAGQVLLAQASFYTVRPPDEVGSIISSLNEVSRRLSAESQDNNMYPESPATKLARALAEQRDRDLPSYPAEASLSKLQQHTPFPDSHNASGNVDFPSVLQHCAASPSSGISPNGLVSFGNDGGNSLNENVMDLAQSVLPSTRVGGWPMTMSSSGRPVGGDTTEMFSGSSGREFDFFSELRRLESRAKGQQEKGVFMGRDMEQTRRRGGASSS